VVCFNEICKQILLQSIYTSNIFDYIIVDGVNVITVLEHKNVYHRDSNLIFTLWIMIFKSRWQ